jgi:uncharacterized protein YkwD
MMGKARALVAFCVVALGGCSAVDDALGGGSGPDNDKGVPCPDAQTPDGCGVITLVNQERASQGLPALRFDPALARAAHAHAADMFTQNYFDHTSLDGRDFAARARAAGYQGSPTGENIAKGQPDAVAVMRSWMNSDGHRKNILSSASNEIGVGVEQRVWVQVFGEHE